MKDIGTGKCNTGGVMGSGVPASGKNEPKGPKQSSGKTQHMRSGDNIENLNNMPTVHG